VDFCFVNDGMAIYHHKGDYAARTISPEIAFLFTRLRIGAAAREGCANSWVQVPPVELGGSRRNGQVPVQTARLEGIEQS
jgi:hypothetical protein